MRDICYCPNSRLIITGYKGYIGSQLIQKLLDSSIETKFEIGQIEYYIAEALCVIHLGASVEPKLDSLNSNLSTDIKLIQILNRTKVPLLYSSSNNIYPFKSNCYGNDYVINDCYSASKVFGEQIIENFSEVPYILLRIGDVFGVGQKHGNFFRNIEASIKNSLPLKLYGDGLKVRSYVYADELCKMILYFTQNIIEFSGNKFNLCNPENANLKSIIEYIAFMTDLKVNMCQYELQKEINDYRTMKLNLPTSYIFEYNTLWLAIDDYITKIKKG